MPANAMQSHNADVSLRKAILRALTVAIVFGILAWAEITYTRGEGRFAALWLPNAVLTAALLLNPARRFAPIFVAASFAANVIANIVAGDSVSVGFGLAGCNAIEVLIIASTIGSLRTNHLDLSDVKELVYFVIFGGFVAPAFSGFLASTLFIEPTLVIKPPLWLSWAVTDALGLLLAAPPIVIFARGMLDGTVIMRRPVSDYIWVLGGVIVSTTLVFSQNRFPILFMATPFVIISAFRLGTGGTAIAVILVAIVASIATSLGSGPIMLVHGDLSAKLLILQLFLAENFAIGLPVAAALEARKRLQRDLAEARDYATSILASTQEIVFRTDLDGLLSFLNPAWERITGRSVEGSLGEHAAAHVDPLQRADVERNLADLALGKVQSGSAIRRFVRQDGEQRHLEVSFRAIVGDDGAFKGSAGIMRDVTERIHAEQHAEAMQSRLIHVSRVSAMDTMASTFAHELNQPLASVANYVRGLRRMFSHASTEADPSVIEVLESIDSGVTRAGEIVRRLRALVENGHTERRSESIEQLLSDACTIGLIDAKAMGVTHTVSLDDGVDYA